MKGNNIKCPWCEEQLIFEESYYLGPYGKMKILRCKKCYKLISARKNGEPEKIIKKELIERGSY